MPLSDESVIPGLIRQAILDTFAMQVNTKVDIASVSMVKNGESNHSIDCLSVIGIESSGHTGSLALWFPKSTFLGVLERMLGEKFEDVSPENADAASELLNIIYASARLKINEAGFDFKPAIPTSIFGRDLVVGHGANTHVLRISCESEIGPFAVGFSLKKVAAAQAA